MRAVVRHERPPDEDDPMLGVDAGGNPNAADQPAEELLQQGVRRNRRPRLLARIRRRFRDAFAVVRGFVFVHTPDEPFCMRVRHFLQFHYANILWMVLSAAVHRQGIRQERQLDDLLQDFAAVVPTSERAPLQTRQLLVSMAALVEHVLFFNIRDYSPLQDKLTPGQWHAMDELFGAEYKREISAGGVLEEDTSFHSWFTIRTRQPETPIQRTLQDLAVFPHTQTWPVSREDHEARALAYARRGEFASELAAIKDHKATATDVRDILMGFNSWGEANQLAYARFNEDRDAEKTQVLAEKKLLLTRSRRYRLFPTREQRQTLRRFMGTCRATHNMAVSYFRATGDHNSNRLGKLFVTRNHRQPVVYPEGIEPPPAWVHETPHDMRYNVMRRFHSSVKSCFTNLSRGNIKHFTMRFSNKKLDANFTLSEDAQYASIREVPPPATSAPGTKPQFFLSITGLKNIRVKMQSRVDIAHQIEIVLDHGSYFVVIPETVEPGPYSAPQTCIAIDPGIKAFATGIDLEGKVLEFGRGTKDYLGSLRQRKARAQSVIDRFHKQKGRATRTQYRAYARSKREFAFCCAKMKNCVKELHYQTASALVKSYDVILLPRFQTQRMVLRSSRRTHAFNTGMLSLNHYAFRQLLRAKCQRMGKGLVACSEMYTSRTCAHCERVHMAMRDVDVFTCPTCSFSAGRDEHAAFNILRYVSAGALEVFSEGEDNE